MSVPSPGDPIATVSHPSLYKPHIHFFKWGVQSEQRIRGFEIWKHTHLELFLGKIPDALVAGYMRILIDLDLSITAVSTRSDWIFTYKYPRATLVTWEEVKGTDWDLYRMRDSNDLTGFIDKTKDHEWSNRELAILSAAAFSMLGRPYDIPQLLRWIAGRMFNVTRSRWHLIPDLFAGRKVCSVAVAYCYEYTRQRMEARTGKSPWIRPFRDGKRKVDIEATMPADFANSPHFRHAGSNPDWGSNDL